jgi:hypothetical protein
VAHIGEHVRDAAAVKGVGMVLSAAGREPVHSATVDLEGVAGTAAGPEKASMVLVRQGGYCTEADHWYHTVQAGAAAAVHVLQTETERGANWDDAGRGAAVALADSADWDMADHCTAGGETAESAEAVVLAVVRDLAGEKLMQHEVEA